MPQAGFPDEKGCVPARLRGFPMRNVCFGSIERAASRVSDWKRLTPNGNERAFVTLAAARIVT
ncbi:hypothetical protein PSP6_60060 [Paraburkholderia tropica]|uniref:hypothetical protein n=1 Tax=Paraburkholderia tropica TaxID=92647 RepID=UPI001CAFF172|nr:hypothetical protein [Paraburkholderia tropica]CAG9232252.1 hypothetical protein PSP6_60060 [Paraburkholderia tropica]